MRRMPLSADTAQKLAAHLKVPLEHLMHMPQHILLQKLAEMAEKEAGAASENGTNGNPEKNNNE
ncbi:YycC family protein [Cohnella rhizosphaerae]|uniref:YycC family protein n=1 Tax=Cohnella rhizosphaerae TaxID=1457232 RepID=A0A9X4KWJ0_9BACL|nr:YycC family protein [Cohnella rhizosphaerae]MDG0812252.1 YycC family protein [Cohnella rhizosphaerae]